MNGIKENNTIDKKSVIIIVVFGSYFLWEKGSGGRSFVELGLNNKNRRRETNRRGNE